MPTPRIGFRVSTDEDLADDEEFKKHILKMADTLSEGSVVQFPKKFNGSAK